MDAPHKEILKKRIDEILYFIWDPIGVLGTTQARSEYNHIWQKALEGATQTEISAHLAKVVQDQMGLKPDEAHNAMVAALVCDWRDSLDEAQQSGKVIADSCYISADKDSDTEYHATDISDKLADFLNFEYVDALNKEWQIWAYPGGAIYNVRPDRDIASKSPDYHSRPGEGKWQIELVKAGVDKRKVSEAYASLRGGHNDEQE